MTTNNAANINNVVSSSTFSYVYIDKKTASNSSLIEFTGLSSVYSAYVLYLIDIVPVTNYAVLYAQMGNSGGYTTSGYVYINNYSTPSTNPNTSGTTTGTEIRMSPLGISNNSGDHVFQSEIKIVGPGIANKPTHLYYVNGCFTNSDWQYVSGFGRCSGSSPAVSKIKFYMSSGNISSGIFELYGIPA